MLMGNISYGLNIYQVDTRVTDNLNINCLGFIIDSRFKFFQVIWIYELSCNTKAWQGSCEEIVSTTI